MSDPILIPIDEVSHRVIGAGGRARIIVAGVTYELFASGGLLKTINNVRVRLNGGVRLQPAPAKKDME